MDNQEGKARAHAMITGFVQGVGYRYFAFENANRLGLTGWVRNLPTGSVEVAVEGERANLEVFLERLRRGPAGGRVERVRVDWTSANGEFGTFTIRH